MIASLVAATVIAYDHNYGLGIPPQASFSKEFYQATYVRVSPYLYGMLFAFFILRTGEKILSIFNLFSQS